MTSKHTRILLALSVRILLKKKRGMMVVKPVAIKNLSVRSVIYIYGGVVILDLHSQRFGKSLLQPRF